MKKIISLAATLALACMACGTPAGKDTLYKRLGEETGIRAVINDFLTRVTADPKINGFFLNASVNSGRLGDCLVKQVANASGGPQTYDCKTMKAAHLGMKISTQDFNDLVGHLVAALQAKNVSKADIDILSGVLSPMAADIVEDAANNSTVYQRVGRKPAIKSVIDAFITRVAADARINSFFGTTQIDRLKTCLVRQVCSIDGPCKYGQEVDAAAVEPGVSPSNVCRGMVAAHAGINGGSRFITYADFGALVEDLTTELDAAQVTTADKTAILGVLGPMCRDIVKNGTGCP